MRAFTLPPAAAAAHVSAIHQLSAACEDGAWAPVLQRDCEEHLGRYVDAASKGTLTGDAAKAEWQACTAAFTAGEASTYRLTVCQGIPPRYRRSRAESVSRGNVKGVGRGTTG